MRWTEGWVSFKRSQEAEGAAALRSILPSATSHPTPSRAQQVVLRLALGWRGGVWDDGNIVRIPGSHPLSHLELLPWLF